MQGAGEVKAHKTKATLPKWIGKPVNVAEQTVAKTALQTALELAERILPKLAK